MYDKILKFTDTTKRSYFLPLKNARELTYEN